MTYKESYTIIAHVMLLNSMDKMIVIKISLLKLIANYPQNFKHTSSHGSRTLKYCIKLAVSGAVLCSRTICFCLILRVSVITRVT